MKRWLAAASGLALTGGGADAQPPQPHNTGYIVIRVKLSGADGAAVPGGGFPMPPGGPGGLGGPGGFGGPPMPGGGFAQPGGAPGGTPAATADERSVFAVVPYKELIQKVVYSGKAVNEQTNPKHLWASHEFGKTLLFDDGSNVQVYRISGTVEQDIKKKHTDWAKDRKLDSLLEIIKYALSTDHVELAVTYSNELEKLYDSQKNATAAVDTKEAPAKIKDGSVAQFVKAYQEIKPKLEDVLMTPTAAEDWRKRLKATSIAEDKHYALLHFGEQSVSAETVNRRLAELERNFKAFYLWHATQGKALKIPDKRMIVVLANRPSDVDDLRPKLDGLPVISDAFYSPAHNLVVLSPTRLDEAGKTFAEIAKAKYQDGWNRDELLKGKSPIVKGGNFNDLYRTMTYALVDRALEEEASHAAITREGTRQLYSALGILPQHVVLPKWIESGVGSLLQKPKDAGVVKVIGGKNGAAVGLWAGYGSPNYVQLREWRDLWAKKELSATPKELLTNVLTDRYFDAVRTGVDVDPAPVGPAPAGGNGGFAPPGGNSNLMRNRDDRDAQAPGGRPGPGGIPGPGGFGPGGIPGPGGFGPGGIPGAGGTPGGTIEVVPDKAAIKAKLESKAQASSWALIYFLSKTNTPKLHEFFADLDKLPRDMRLDNKVVIEIFAKKFNLMNAEFTAIDDIAFNDFAEKWVRSMNAEQPNWYPQLLKAPENPGQGGPGLPPGPGGGPGLGGFGGEGGPGGR